MFGTLARVASPALTWLSVMAVSAALTFGVTARASSAESVAAQRELLTTGPLSSSVCEVSSTRMLRYAISNGWLSTQIDPFCRMDSN